MRFPCFSDRFNETPSWAGESSRAVDDFSGGRAPLIYWGLTYSRKVGRIFSPIMTIGFENKISLPEPGKKSYPLPLSPVETPGQKLKKYLWSFLVVVILTIPSFFLKQTLDTAAIAMFYLLTLVGIAVWLGRGPAIAASFLGVLALDYFINPPYFSFTITRFESWMTLLLMLVESLVISTLAARLKEQVNWAREREVFTSLLSDLGTDLAETGDDRSFLEQTESYLAQAVGSPVCVLLADETGNLRPWNKDDKRFQVLEWDAAQWCLQNGRKTGLSNGAFYRSRNLYLPLNHPPRLFGVLAFALCDSRKALPQNHLSRLEFFAGQVSSALERNHLLRQVEDHRIEVETEKNRSALLSAVSHDLRTPLTAIKGAASSLMGEREIISDEARSQLSRMIYDEAERMNRLVQNLLDMTRLQATALQLKKEWQSMEELVGSVTDRLKDRLAGRPFTIDLQPDLPLVLVDGLLVEQLLLNLLENALNHTPEGTRLRLSVNSSKDTVELEVLDKGPGIKSGEEKAIFEKFIRGYHGSHGGAGLGLSICRAIAQAHGGSIE
ncbi:MAG TPA: DUF4118 domain-containing protein, partial [bacterium]|nr:DUF4118 domain-containing protein [bacterium]